MRSGAKRVRISPKRAGPPGYLRPGEQRITSFFYNASTMSGYGRGARAAAMLQSKSKEDSGSSEESSQAMTSQIGLQQMPAESPRMQCMPQEARNLYLMHPSSSEVLS